MVTKPGSTGKADARQPQPQSESVIYEKPTKVENDGGYKREVTLIHRNNAWLSVHVGSDVQLRLPGNHVEPRAKIVMLVESHLRLVY